MEVAGPRKMVYDSEVTAIHHRYAYTFLEFHLLSSEGGPGPDEHTSQDLDVTAKLSGPSANAASPSRQPCFSANSAILKAEPGTRPRPPARGFPALDAEGRPQLHDRPPPALSTPLQLCRPGPASL